MDNRPIWFRKVLGSYVPISFMGWVFTAAVVAIGFVLIFAMRAILAAVGRPDLQEYCMFIIIPLVIFAGTIADRYCE
jgi:hypothetical protein